MPAAYLFDMDGLLLDTETLAMASFLAAVGAFGVTRAQAEPFFLTLVGTSVAESNLRMDAFLPAGVNGADIRDLWDQSFSTRMAQGVPLRPLVRETIENLAAQTKNLAVVTSTIGARARHHLAQAGLLDHFAFVLGGDEVSATKPNPAPYLEAALRLGFAPGHCAAFEDSDKGIAAAVQAGCLAVQIPDLRPLGLPLPDLGQMVAQDLASAVSLAQNAAKRQRSGGAKHTR